MRLFMVFDVESIGLHGDGYAVGWVVVDANDHGRELGRGKLACDPEAQRGTTSSHAWVKENIPSFWPFSDSAHKIREGFWNAWMYWKAQGAILAADCPWPVEARFLCACVDEQPTAREWQGPYPLIDVASVRLAAGLDPLASGERLPFELPVHDPEADARQSARLLLEALEVAAARKAAGFTDPA